MKPETECGADVRSNDLLGGSAGAEADDFEPIAHLAKRLRDYPTISDLICGVAALELEKQRDEIILLSTKLAAIEAHKETIGRMLADAMDVAASNGANSVSMPDEYVALAVWLCDA